MVRHSLALPHLPPPPPPLLLLPHPRSPLTPISCLQGVLRGFDQTINLILAESYERILSPTEAAQRIELGLYLIRGENVAIVGEMDEDKDAELKVGEKNAELIKPVVH